VDGDITIIVAERKEEEEEEEEPARYKLPTPKGKGGGVMSTAPALPFSSFLFWRLLLSFLPPKK
jgi:hypothetical protein